VKEQDIIHPALLLSSSKPTNKQNVCNQDSGEHGSKLFPKPVHRAESIIQHNPGTHIKSKEETLSTFSNIVLFSLSKLPYIIIVAVE